MYSFVYNINAGQIVVIFCSYDSNDQSQYDYLGDYEKVVETAKLTVEAINSNAINSTNSVESASQVVPSSSSSSSTITATPTATPKPTTQASQQYIGNINTKKFHLPSCRSLPYPENQIIFNTRAAAIDAGYVPCKICNP